MKRGFSLIEAMVSVAIVGVLAAMVIYVTLQAQRQARDARRKSDLSILSLAFEARYVAKTCPNLSEVGFYPGRNLGVNPAWKAVSVLAGSGDGCGAFSEYLISIPQDPTRNATYPYLFNLSNESGLTGKHFRLAAALEKVPTSQESTELDRMERSWVNTFNGGPFPSGYTYVIGK